jgi:rhomboid family protein
MFIPYPIKAKYLLPIVILISAYLGIRQFEWDNVAHFAHIGGALVGWLMIRNWKANRNIR